MEQEGGADPITIAAGLSVPIGLVAAYGANVIGKDKEAALDERSGGIIGNLKTITTQLTAERDRLRAEVERLKGAAAVCDASLKKTQEAVSSLETSARESSVANQAFKRASADTIRTAASLVTETLARRYPWIRDAATFQTALLYPASASGKLQRLSLPQFWQRRLLPALKLDVPGSKGGRRRRRRRGGRTLEEDLATVETAPPTGVAPPQGTAAAYDLPTYEIFAEAYVAALGQAESSTGKRLTLAKTAKLDAVAQKAAQKQADLLVKDIATAEAAGVTGSVVQDARALVETLRTPGAMTAKDWDERYRAEAATASKALKDATPKEPGMFSRLFKKKDAAIPGTPTSVAVSESTAASEVAPIELPPPAVPEAPEAPAAPAAAVPTPGTSKWKQWFAKKAPEAAPKAETSQTIHAEIRRGITRMLDTVRSQRKTLDADWTKAKEIHDEACIAGIAAYQWGPETYEKLVALMREADVLRETLRLRQKNVESLQKDYTAATKGLKLVADSSFATPPEVRADEIADADQALQQEQAVAELEEAKAQIADGVKAGLAPSEAQLQKDLETMLGTEAEQKEQAAIRAARLKALQEKVAEMKAVATAEEVRTNLQADAAVLAEKRRRREERNAAFQAFLETIKDLPEAEQFLRIKQWRAEQEAQGEMRGGALGSLVDLRSRFTELDAEVDVSKKDVDSISERLQAMTKKLQSAYKKGPMDPAVRAKEDADRVVRNGVRAKKGLGPLPLECVPYTAQPPPVPVAPVPAPAAPAAPAQPGFVWPVGTPSTSPRPLPPMPAPPPFPPGPPREVAPEPSDSDTAVGKDGAVLQIGDVVSCKLYQRTEQGRIRRFVRKGGILYVESGDLPSPYNPYGRSATSTWSQPASACTLVMKASDYETAPETVPEAAPETVPEAAPEDTAAPQMEVGGPLPRGNEMGRPTLDPAQRSLVRGFAPSSQVSSFKGTVTAKKRRTNLNLDGGRSSRKRTLKKRRGGK